MIFFTGQHQGLLVWLLVGYIGFFAFSQGAVIWVSFPKFSPIRSGPRVKASVVSPIGSWRGHLSGFSSHRGVVKASAFVFFAAIMVLAVLRCAESFRKRKACLWRKFRRNWGSARLLFSGPGIAKA